MPTSIDNDSNNNILRSHIRNDEKSQQTADVLPQGDSSTTTELDSARTRTIRGVPWFIICSSLNIACLLYGLDTTLAADVQGPVTKEFGQVEKLSWIGAGFPLGSVCVILLLGRLLNTFNMKWIFIATVTLFEAGSALCGAAPNMDALIVGRVMAGAISAPAYIFYLPSIRPTQGVSIRARLATIDFAGFVLGSCIWAASGRGTIATFVVFVVVLVAYALQQGFSIVTTPDRRAFPCHLLRDRTQVLLYIVTAAGTTTLFVVVYYIPIYLQFVNNDAALMAAVRLLPFIVVGVTANLVSGSLLHMIKIYMALYIIAGLFLSVGGALLMVYLEPSTSTATVYGLTVLVAVVSGLSMVTGHTVATFTTRPEDASAGLCMQNVAQIGGQVLALAVADQTYQSTAIRNLSAALAGNGFSDADIRSAVAGTQSTLFETLDGELRDKAVLAVSQAMQMTLVMVPVAGAVMLIATLCMKREKLFVRSVLLLVARG